MKIKEARALITGGASGLGHAVAQRVVAEGGKVALLDVQEAAGVAAARALGANASFHRCDVTSESAVNAAVAAAREIRDGEVVFAGTGLPMLGAMLAKRTHAPGCTIVFEAGAVDPHMLHLPMSVGDSRTPPFQFNIASPLSL